MIHSNEESRVQLISDLQERAEELTQLNRIAIALTSEFELQRLLGSGSTQGDVVVK